MHNQGSIEPCHEL